EKKLCVGCKSADLPQDGPFRAIRRFLFEIVGIKKYARDAWDFNKVKKLVKRDKEAFSSLLMSGEFIWDSQTEK
ncbi:hypothetical protein KI387_021208, partial [Taxus chinensis]